MQNLLNSLMQPAQQASNPNVEMFKRMAGMLTGSKNPMQALGMIAQQNPLVSQAMQLCNGKKPKDVFIAQCKSMGIDPNDAMRQLGLK